MNSFRTTLFLAASLCIPVISVPAQKQGICHTPDSFSDHLLTVVKSLMAPGDTATRRVLGIPTVQTSQILIVTDSTVCARAGQALDSVATSWNPGAPNPPAGTIPLYVVKIGDSYGILDPTAPPKEWYFIFFFGPLWDYHGTGTI